ncbi:unnamed protein product [Diplocarpon coronariae]
MRSVYPLVALGTWASSVAADLPLVASDVLQRGLLRSALVEKSEALLSLADDNTRLYGTSGHNKTVDWIQSALSAYSNYYDVEVQPFQMPAVVTTFRASATRFVADAMEMSPEGSVSAPLVLVADNGCAAADFPPEVAGAISLIKRGSCPFGQKSAIAGGAGAVGVIHYNNVGGRLTPFTLGNQSDYPQGPFAPTAGVSDVVGASLLSLLAAGPVHASLSIDSTELTTYNVFAQTKGGDQDNVLELGAHSDSVIEGRLSHHRLSAIPTDHVAQLLTNFSVNHAVRFSWFSAEEQGKRGSYHYLNSLSEEELAGIRLFLNFDMIASPNYIYGIYDGDGSSFNVSGAAGSGEAEKLFEDFFAQEGLPFEPIVLRLSDSLPFFEAGIPTGGLFTGATENKTDEQAARFGGQAGVPFDLAYHTALDDVNNLNLTAFLNNAKAIAHTVATYAVSWEGEYGVPKRTKRDLKARVRRPVWKKARKSADT